MTKEAAKNGKMFHANSLIISTSATLGEYALITVPFLCNQRFTCLTPKDCYKDAIIPDFMMYYASTWYDLCHKYINRGNFDSVSMSEFRKFPFPIIDINTQSKIIDNLNALNTYSQSIVHGLPKEIALRSQQNVYYLNRFF